MSRPSTGTHGVNKPEAAAVVEPEPKPVALPKPKRASKAEPAKPRALGQEIRRMEVDALRIDERSALRFIRDHGPMTLNEFRRNYKLKPAARQRLLQDLDRYGLIAGYWDAKGRGVIHATERAEPIFDVDLDGPWTRKPGRGAKGSVG